MSRPLDTRRGEAHNDLMDTDHKGNEMHTTAITYSTYRMPRGSYSVTGKGLGIIGMVTKVGDSWIAHAIDAPQRDLGMFHTRAAAVAGMIEANALVSA
jgi:hypothetical protein